MRIKYFSHSAFQIITNQNEKILLDPFLDDNPTSPVNSDEVKADYIVLTHAHGDHLGDAVKIAKRDDALIIAVNELANYVKEQGANAHNMHIGGSYDFAFGKVKFTIAHHGSSSPDKMYMGEPAGVILSIDDKNIYHAGDTGLFLDMKLIGEMNKIDYMILPIGGNFTMDIDDAVKAVEFVNPGTAVPMHYNTFPVIEVNPDDFKKKIEGLGKNCKVFKYGEEFEV